MKVGYTGVAENQQAVPALLGSLRASTRRDIAIWRQKVLTGGNWTPPYRWFGKTITVGPEEIVQTPAGDGTITVTLTHEMEVL